MENKNGMLNIFLLIIYLCSFTLIFTLASHTSVETYLQTLKQANVERELDEQSMLQEIEKLAKQIEQPAIDARIDRIWKAIPSYNGLQVDLQRSLHFSKKVGEVSTQTLIMQEVEPKVDLHDLPPYPIYRGNSKKPMIALMINVAWGTEYIEKMLSIFDDYQIRVTFFLDGMWLEKHPEIAEKMSAAGHEIGNHAYSHPDMSKLTVFRMREEIEKTENLIKQLGTKSSYFTPPAGAYDHRVVQVANELGLQTVLWTLDTVDWQKPPASTILNRIVPHLENGSLILMHPTNSTVEALPKIIEAALVQGLIPVSVSELLSPTRKLSIEGLK